LAFHPYPQVIREFCNMHRFGPPARVTVPSACSWIDHPVSGLLRRTDRPVRTRFRYAYTYRLKLARQSKSLTHYTKGTPSGLRPPTVCKHPVSGTVSLPSSGCFSPFPHGTGSLSVVEEYLGLEGGPPTFRQDFTCPALLKDPCRTYPYGAVTRSGPTFQTVPVFLHRPLAWSAFARHY
jgi:hypothetical protein